MASHAERIAKITRDKNKISNVQPVIQEEVSKTVVANVEEKPQFNPEPPTPEPTKEYHNDSQGTKTVAPVVHRNFKIPRELKTKAVNIRLKPSVLECLQKIANGYGLKTTETVEKAIMAYYEAFIINQSRT